jgi:hypothetical protein
MARGLSRPSELRPAVSVERYGTSGVPVLAKLENPKVAVLLDGHFVYALLPGSVDRQL